MAVSFAEPTYQPPGLHEEPEKSALSGTSIELFAKESPTMASKLTAERIAILHAGRQEWDFLQSSLHQDSKRSHIERKSGLYFDALVSINGTLE
jgi:hypothetical protein